MRRRKRSEEARKKDRQKQGHKKRGPLGCSLLGETEEGHRRPPKGAPSSRQEEKREERREKRREGQRREEKSREEKRRENIDQVTWGYTHHVQQCYITRWEQSQYFLSIYAWKKLYTTREKGGKCSADV